MARYRCFCMTEDGRIITGTFIVAGDASEAMELAWRMWAGVPRFSHVEMWKDDVRVDSARTRPGPESTADQLA